MDVQGDPPSTLTYLLTVRVQASASYDGLSRDERIAKAKAHWAAIRQSAIERLAAYPGIHIVGDLWLSRTLLAQSTPEEFKRVFGADVDYRTFRYNNLNRGPQTGSDWRLSGTPVVPVDLEDIVSDVALNSRIFLTD